MPETTEKSWYSLLKFGQRAHIERFRDGILHMNPQKYFADLDNDPVRADRFETADRIHQPKDIQRLRIQSNNIGEEIVIPQQNIVGPLIVGFGRVCYNLFCMHAVSESSASSLLVDPRNFAFGDSFIVVLETQEFVDRVSAAGEATGFGIRYGPIEYYDPTEYSGDVGPFRKPSTFNYQREFRIAVYPGLAKPIRLNVGSLVDITTPILSLADINESVSITPVADPRATSCSLSG